MEKHQPNDPNSEEVKAVPVGYRFDPSDQQLLTSYLLPKLKREAVPVLPESRTCPFMMTEIELYGGAGKEPWNLFAKYARPNKKFYVFCKLEKKSESGSGTKLNRVAGCGTWDLQSTNFVSHGGRQLGRKRLFRFELRNKSETETNIKIPRWIMHEFTLDGFPSYALCEIQNMVSAKDLAESSSSSSCREDDDGLDLDEYLDQKRNRSDDSNDGHDQKRLRISYDNYCNNSLEININNNSNMVPADFVPINHNQQQLENYQQQCSTHTCKALLQSMN